MICTLLSLVYSFSVPVDTKPLSVEHSRMPSASLRSIYLSFYFIQYAACFMPETEQNCFLHCKTTSSQTHAESDAISTKKSRKPYRYGMRGMFKCYFA